MELSDYIDSMVARVENAYDDFGVAIDSYKYKRHIKYWAENKQPLVDRLGLTEGVFKVEFPLDYIKNGRRDVHRGLQTLLHVLRDAYCYLTSRDNRNVIEQLFSLLGTKVDHEELYGNQLVKYLSKDKKKLKVGKQEIKLLSVFKLLEKQWDYDRDKLMMFTDGSYKDWYYKKMQKVVEDFTQAVCEVPIKDTLVISIDPVDFVLASEITNGWQSCFRIDGEYHASTNSFIRAESIAIAYILDGKGQKKYRQWVVLGDNFFSKGRSYPDVCDSRNKEITKVLKGLYKGGKSFSYYKDYSPLEGANGVYLDPFSTWHHHKSRFPMIELDSGLDCDGYSTDGHFTNNSTCEDCGEIHHQDDLYWSEWHERYIGSCCIDNYAWCEDVDAYVELDYCRYLVDTGNYVSEGCSYCIYLEDRDEWVSNRYDYYYAVDTDECYGDCDDLYYVEDTGDYYKYSEGLYLHSDGYWYTYEEEKEEEC